MNEPWNAVWGILRARGRVWLALAALSMGDSMSVSAQLVPTLEWEVGGRESGLIFGNAVTGEFLANGHIVVRDVMNRSLHLLDGAGRELAEFGGRGSGPGEFQGLGPMVPTDSTLIVSDTRLGRYTVFGLDGTFYRTKLAPFRARPATRHRMLTDSSGLLDHLDLLAPGGDPVEVKDHVAYFFTGGAHLDTLVSLRVGAIGGYADGRIFFVQNYSEPEGDVDLVGDSVLVAGQGPTALIRWWRLGSHGADLVTEFDPELHREAIDRVTCDRVLEQYLDANPELRRELPSDFRVSCPPHWSAVLNIVGVSASEAWVELNRSPGLPVDQRRTEWVFVDGRVGSTTAVRLPDGIRILASQGDRILTLRRTHLDVPIIQLWSGLPPGRHSPGMSPGAQPR